MPALRVRVRVRVRNLHPRPTLTGLTRSACWNIPARFVFLPSSTIDLALPSGPPLTDLSTIESTAATHGLTDSANNSTGPHSDCCRPSIFIFPPSLSLSRNKNCDLAIQENSMDHSSDGTAQASDNGVSTAQASSLCTHHLWLLPVYCDLSLFHHPSIEPTPPCHSYS